MTGDDPLHNEATGPDLPPRRPGTDGRRTLDLALVAGTVVIGVFAMIGCLLATLLESAGFGAPGGDPRAGYLALLFIGVVASAAGPTAVALWRVPHARGFAVPVGVATSVLGVGLYVLALMAD